MVRGSNTGLDCTWSLSSYLTSYLGKGTFYACIPVLMEKIMGSCQRPCPIFIHCLRYFEGLEGPGTSTTSTWTWSLRQFIKSSLFSEVPRGRLQIPIGSVLSQKIISPCWKTCSANGRGRSLDVSPTVLEGVLMFVFMTRRHTRAINMLGTC